MKETSEMQTVRALRRPRCSLLTACQPVNPLKLWNKYAGRYDQPIFSDGEDPNFDHWQLQMQSRMEANADHTHTKALRMAYVQRPFNLACDQSFPKNSRIDYVFELSKIDQSQ